LKIVVNGEARETEAETLADLCRDMGFDGRPVATAVNGAFVAAAARRETRIDAGDRVEILSPRQGG
jgi:sulfur carrier protein